MNLGCIQKSSNVQENFCKVILIAEGFRQEILTLRGNGNQRNIVLHQELTDG